MFKGPTEDRLAIRETIDAYTDAVFRGDAEDWGACWAEDGRWDLGQGEVVGRAQIVAAWKQAMANFSFVAFSASPGEISVEGDEARARVYTTEFLIGRDDSQTRIVGRYDDRLVKEGGRWRFRSRAYKILHRE